jgi:6-phosphofructokinase 2
VLSLGEGGAWLVTAKGACFAPGLPIKVVSATGAGDSFVGAMVWALARGIEMKDAFRYGVAAGSAALLSKGTGLCQAADVARLYDKVIVM